jgi:hypothetical protein
VFQFHFTEDENRFRRQLSRSHWSGKDSTPCSRLPAPSPVERKPAAGWAASAQCWRFRTRPRSGGTFPHVLVLWTPEDIQTLKTGAEIPDRKNCQAAWSERRSARHQRTRVEVVTASEREDQVSPTSNPDQDRQGLTGSSFRATERVATREIANDLSMRRHCQAYRGRRVGLGSGRLWCRLPRHRLRIMRPRQLPAHLSGAHDGALLRQRNRPPDYVVVATC